MRLQKDYVKLTKVFIRPTLSTCLAYFMNLNKDLESISRTIDHKIFFRS